MSPLEDTFIHDLICVADEMSRLLNKKLEKANTGITADQFKLLKILWEEDGKTQQFISQSSRRDRGTITRMIDVLEKKKLISRKPDKSDKRINLIHLTPAGKEIEALAMKCSQETYEQTLRDFKVTEINLFKNYLKKAMTNLERH